MMGFKFDYICSKKFMILTAPNKTPLILLLFVMMIVTSTCSRKVVIPAYINIPAMVITSDYLKQGSTSANITDVWVYVNGKLTGIYPLPCKFPVATIGTDTITIQPGIKKNAQSGDRINYPFYGSYDTILTLVAEKEYTINPRVPYRNATKMEYFEDFENGGVRLKKGPLNNTDSFMITSDATEVFEGKSSGKFVLKMNSNMEYVTTDSYVLPGNGVETYIELNYKSEADLEIGFYHNSPGSVIRYPLLGVYKNVAWKKVYLRITEEISTQLIKYPGASSFGLYLEAKNIDTPYKKVLIDNLKLVRL